MANSFHTKMQHRTPLKLEKMHTETVASSSFFLFNESKNFVVFLENSTYVLGLFKKPKYVRSSDFAHFWKAEIDSRSKLFHTFFSKVGLKGPEFALKFCTFYITTKENTVISSISLWQ